MQTLRTMIPVYWWGRTVILLLIFMSLAGLFLFKPPSNEVARQLWPPFGYVSALLIAVSLFDLFIRRGYQVSYDDQSIYWRKVGFRGRFNKPIVMPFSAITGVVPEAGSLGVRPFEAAVLQAGTGDIPDIVLSQLYLRKWEMKSLLSEVAAKSHASFDPEVRDFIDEAD